MTVREAILTLNANVVIACERARFNSATVKMVEDALDTIEDDKGFNWGDENNG